MPFCPECRSEYVAGTRTCEDCGAGLVDVLPARNPSGPGERDLVEVWHTQGEMEAQVIRALLESHDVPSMFRGESLRLTHGLTLDGLAEVRILVREVDGERASAIIASMDGMRQCPACRRPARENDARCHYCDTVLET